MTAQLVAVLIGDLHIGKRWQSHTTPQTRAALSERYYSPLHEAIGKYGDTAASLISAGDWFDKSHNDEQTVLRSAEFISKFGLVVAGNHDVLNRVDDISSLKMLSEFLPQKNIVIDRPTLASLEVPARHFPALQTVAVACVPHQLTQESFERELKSAVHLAEVARETGATGAILVTHCNYHGNEGKPDSDLYLTPELQAMLEPHFDFIFLGHEHLFKQQGKVVVLGSCQPCNFGEMGPRFFHELWLENNELSVKRVPIQSAMQHREILLHKKVSDDFTELSQELPELVTISGILELTEAARMQELVRHLYQKGALAVRVNVEFDTGTTLAGDQVKGSLSNLVEIVKEEISENTAWLEMFESILSTIPQEQK